ncbi:MAG: hypothetical protein IH606_15130 [Burkholderiales bacterium]|nr:hypothetical protein [Burkholderiales bacterium]
MAPGLRPLALHPRNAAIGYPSAIRQRLKRRACDRTQADPAQVIQLDLCNTSCRLMTDIKTLDIQQVERRIDFGAVQQYSGSRVIAQMN